MSNFSLAFNTMNNSYDPNFVLEIQRLLAAQQAQRDLENAQVRQSNPFLGQFLRANVRDQCLVTRPPALSFPGVTNPVPDYAMLQAMMMMNNERAAADRNRLLLMERANRERAARFMTDRVIQQERIIQNNERALQSLDRKSSITVPHHGATAVEDRAIFETIAQNQSQMVQGDQVHRGASTSAKKRLRREKQPKANLGDGWLAGYEAMRRYKEEYGDCLVTRISDPLLARWAAEQRKQYKLFQGRKDSSITPSRIELLNEIGFPWKASKNRLPSAKRQGTTQP